MRTKIDLYFKIVEPKITQEQFITHLASLDSKFGVVATNKDLTLDQNLIQFIGCIVTENFQEHIESPLQLILLTEAYKSISCDKELDETQFSDNLKDIYMSHIQSTTRTPLNLTILKLLRNLDVVPVLVGIKDAAVLIQLLQQGEESIFD